MMSPERAAHALIKLSAQIALREGVRRAGLPCGVFPDGRRRVAGARVEPDALDVGRPPPISARSRSQTRSSSSKVLSLSTAADDHGVKLDGYFSLGSVSHYLILDPDRRVMIHHRRGHAGAIETRVLREGVVVLDPPGFEAQVVEFFAREST